MRPLTITARLFGVLTASLLVSTPALAGTTVVITYGPFTNQVPALGGVGLVILSALLGVVSLRFLKDRKRGGGHFLTLALVTGALATGGSGIKLISEAHAITIGAELTNPEGGSVNINVEGTSPVRNTSGRAQEILTIDPSPGCSILAVNGGNGGFRNGGNGGSFLGNCDDSPGTILGQNDFCEITVCCTVNGGNGGCAPF